MHIIDTTENVYTKLKNAIKTHSSITVRTKGYHVYIHCKAPSIIEEEEASSNDHQIAMNEHDPTMCSNSSSLIVDRKVNFALLTSRASSVRKPCCSLQSIKMRLTI